MWSLLTGATHIPSLTGADVLLMNSCTPVYSAEIVMDFHAHLDRNEVIGLLSGSWDAAARQLRIERAFPVREAVHGNGHIDVEMDPEDQYKVCDRV